jgi:hypothetical protein
MSNVVIIVVCCNAERMAFQRRQYAALALPYRVVYFPAFTPRESSDWIREKDPISPEYDSMMCAVRSQAAAIDWYVREAPEPYALIVEDDVTFRTDGLHDAIQTVIEYWEKYRDEIDYVSVGYLLGDKQSHTRFQHGPLYWGPQDPLVWGNQAYLIRKDVAREMAAVLHQPHTTGLRERVRTIDATRGLYSRRETVIQPDALWPDLFRQAFVWPVLGVEAPFSSAILGKADANTRRLRAAVETGRVDLRLFYSDPAPPAAAASCAQTNSPATSSAGDSRSTQLNS